jgi:hypothetical protein
MNHRIEKMLDKLVATGETNQEGLPVWSLQTRGASMTGTYPEIKAALIAAGIGR